MARLSAWTALLSLGALAAGCATTSTTGAAGAGSAPVDREAIAALVAAVADHVDGKRWPQLRALFADEVATDYTSLFGGTPQRQAGDAIVGGWQKVLTPVSTQHLLGPVVIEVAGATATAHCHVRAWHLAKGAPGGEEWVVGGRYLFTLARAGAGWRITGLTLETFHQTGNTKLLAEAAAVRR
jgi:hypothetical protein